MPQKLFSILIGCYGDHPDLSLRAVRSVIGEEKDSEQERDYDIHVAASACCRETVDELRALLDSGDIDTFAAFKKNIHLCPMKRFLIDRAKTEYILWMDDDSHMLPGWETVMPEFIKSNSPFDVAGKLRPLSVIDKDEEYKEFLRSRPWYVSEEREECDGPFLVSGLQIFRTAFLRAHNYPDRSMIYDFEDSILGDLLYQQRGRLIGFPSHILTLFKISDAESRGESSRKCKFSSVDPLTGF